MGCSNVTVKETPIKSKRKRKKVIYLKESSKSIVNESLSRQRRQKLAVENLFTIRNNPTSASDQIWSSAELQKKIAEKGVSAGKVGDAEKMKDSGEEGKGRAELRCWVVMLSGMESAELEKKCVVEQRLGV
ncbi:hypothetical protein PIB30_082151 [Stylosanthes scabra]|uniref:Uncharacterized protein n=1 Tax=Stylosanthes scabra TaxID=79078 RepID=A0ABU6URH4_9FABA|nr:hypothetical protein [Stylosanthes scabra]